MNDDYSNLETLHSLFLPRLEKYLGWVIERFTEETMKLSQPDWGEIESLERYRDKVVAEQLKRQQELLTDLKLTRHTT